MRERLVHCKHLTPFCAFAIVLASGTRIHVKAPGQLGPFVAEAAQFTEVRGRSRWIPYDQIASLEFTEPPLLPPERLF